MPMTTSQRPASSELRMKPRRCGSQKYSRVRCSSCATSAAILFSNPSPGRFENGRLFGSAQTRSGASARPVEDASSAHTASSAPRGLKTEDIHRASWRRVLLDVLHRANHPERGIGVVSRNLGKCHGAHPPADACVDG